MITNIMAPISVCVIKNDHGATSKKTMIGLDPFYRIMWQSIEIIEFTPTMTTDVLTF